jgi:ATP phosphoribosyltransferase regulatory subunit
MKPHCDSLSVSDVIQSLHKTLEGAGYTFVDVPTLQYADDVIDLAGEKARASLYLMESSNEKPLCLRHDLTLPLAELYRGRQNITPKGQERLAASGVVYRRPQGANVAIPMMAEKYQVDFEHFGGAGEAPDFDCVGLTLKALVAVGIRDMTLCFNNFSLMTSVINALDLPVRRALALKRNLWNPQKFLALLTHYQQGAGAGLARHTFLATLADIPADKAAVILETLFKEGGAPHTPARTAAEITGRLLDKAAEAALPPLTAQQRETLTLVFSLKGHTAHIRQGLELNPCLTPQILETFLTQVTPLEALAEEYSLKIMFDGSMGRGMEYYTGLVFDVMDRAGNRLAGGGRYDHLLTAMGSPQPITAIGSCFDVAMIAHSLQGGHPC